ncbi:MAG: HNH endonuclease [Clostridia bacterium]|nr:HNH endonuclease [Clostridia bacterium]
MFIQLPKEYVFVKGGRVSAYVNKEGILKIYEGQVFFDDLMYALAYNINQIDVCPYCGRPIRKRNLELDHKFPRDFGGISITNNLLPCCNKCNSDKGNLNRYEYERLLEKKDCPKKERTKEKYKIIQNKEKLRYEKKSFLPNKWVKNIDLTKLNVRECYLKHYNKSTKRMADNFAYIAKYGNLKRPVIVDKNFWIIDGFTWYLAAMETEKFKKIPVIVLENVEVVF